jgi:ankyrin repeat protein
MAILNNKPACVKLLLEVKDAETMADNKGLVPLHYAAQFGVAEILNQCCDISTNLDPTDHQRRTPLMLAAGAGRFFAVKTLIERGAKKELTDAQGLSVFDYAKQSGHSALVDWLEGKKSSPSLGGEDLS